MLMKKKVICMFFFTKKTLQATLLQELPTQWLLKRATRHAGIVLGGAFFLGYF